MAILDRESKIIYTGGNIAWLPYVIQRGFNFSFRYKNGKIVPLDTLEKYKKEVGLIGYEVIELEEIYKSFGIEIIEIGETAVLIDGVIIDSKTDSKNIVLSFVKIACELGYCTSKANFASRKSKLRKIKRNRELYTSLHHQQHIVFMRISKKATSKRKSSFNNV